MNMSDPFFWNNYRQSASWFQDEILKQIEQELPELPFREQADLFQGAPKSVILQFFGDLSWDSQVIVWNKYLPTGARLKAFPLLKEQAAIKLGLKPKKKRNVFC